MPPSPRGGAPQSTSEIFGNIVPQVNITKVTLENAGINVINSAQGLLVKVNLEIKVPKSTGLLSSIVGSELLQESLYVRVVIASNSAHFRKFGADPRELMMISSPVSSRGMTGLRVANIRLTEFESGATDYHGLQSHAGLGTTVEEDGQSFDVYHKEVTMGVRNETTGFVGINAVPYIKGKDLVREVLTPSDVGGRSLGFEDENFFGEIKSLLVIENDIISSTEWGIRAGTRRDFSFRDVTFTSTGERGSERGTESRTREWRSGQFESLGQVNKVQDFRVRDRIESLSFDFSIIDKDIFPNLQRDLRGNYLKMNKQTNHFSDIYLSRDIDNNCRFLFSINWKNILLDNSVFGNFFRGGSQRALNHLLQRTRINNLKIFRTQVEGTKDNQPFTNPKDFNQNSISDVIVDTGESSESRTVNTSNFQELDERDFGPEDVHYLRNFTCVDTDVSNKTAGYYKYTVEIQCIDETIGLIEEMLSGGSGAAILSSTTTTSNRGLRDYIQRLQNYYKEATSPSWSMYHRGTRRGFSASFNTKTNSFSKRFTQLWVNPYYWNPLASDIDSFVELLDFFTDFRPEPREDVKQPGEAGYEEYAAQAAATPATKEGISIALKGMINAGSGSPQSIHTVLQLMESVASKIESILGVVYLNVPGTQGGSETPAKKSQVTGKNRLFKVSDDSIDLFDANLGLYHGFDFTGTTTGPQAAPPPAGLLQQSQNYLESIGREGIGRYFDVNKIQVAGSDPSITPWSSGASNNSTPLDYNNVGLATTFLSPSNIYAGGTKSKPDALVSQKQTVALPRTYLKIIQQKMGTSHNPRSELLWLRDLSRLRQPVNSLERLALSRNLSSFFALFHGTAIDPRENILPHIQNPGPAPSPSDRQAFESDRYKSEAYQNLQSDADAYEPMIAMWSQMKLISGNIQEIEQPSRRIKAKEFYSLQATDPLEGSLQVELYKDFGSYPEFISQAPVQIKALMYLKVDASMLTFRFKDLIDLLPVGTGRRSVFDYDAAFEYSTQIINQLQVLVDFGRGDAEWKGGEVLLKKPDWQPYHLAKTGLSPNRSYLCRISPYEDEKYLIKRNSKYNLPTYDEYFIMRAS